MASDKTAQKDFWPRNLFTNRRYCAQLPALDPGPCQRPGRDGRDHGDLRHLAEIGNAGPLPEDDQEEEDEFSVHAAVVDWSRTSSPYEDTPGQSTFWENVFPALLFLFFFALCTGQHFFGAGSSSFCANWVGGVSSVVLQDGV